jgi:8-oxo-dGTP pyrophosphatase MutT (NUDIX family)
MKHNKYISNYKEHRTCNNCGKFGHDFHECIYPITSYGVIAYRITSKGEREYILIRRKDTLGYIEFIRGKYSIHNKDYIQNIVNEMTNREKQQILTMPFNDLWNKLWGKYKNHYRNEKIISETKFNTLQKGVKFDNVMNIRDFIENSPTSWIEPEWEFPKGRRNRGENNKETALREFSEETGIAISKLDIIDNIIPFTEIYTGSNYKSYKHVYYLGKLTQTDPNELSNYQKTEVGDIGWFTFSEVLDRIRPYSREKIDVITNIERLFENIE